MYLNKQGTGKAIAVGIGAELVVPFGLLAIQFGRTLKGSVFGGIKAKSDLTTIANKCQKEVIHLNIKLFILFIFITVVKDDAYAFKKKFSYTGFESKIILPPFSITTESIVKNIVS